MFPGFNSIYLPNESMVSSMDSSMGTFRRHVSYLVRARYARYKAMEPATAALSDPTCPRMGSLSRMSHFLRVSSCRPSPSEPTTSPVSYTHLTLPTILLV